MAGVIATIPKFQFSANGVPMVGGTLETYIAGSTTPATTWQDAALTIANTNPISLDARGECVIWLDPAVTYKFVLKNSPSNGGVIQWTQDNISNPSALVNALRADLAASSGAAIVGYLPATLPAKTLQAELRLLDLKTVNVQDYVTGGLGTRASPWTGWDTGITWTSHTQYDFLDGVYGYSTSPNFGLDFLRLNCKAGTVLRHTGGGYAMLVDAGPLDTDFRVQININCRLESNAGATGGVYCRGVSRAHFDIRFNDVPGVQFREIGGVLNTLRLYQTGFVTGQSIIPISMLVVGQRTVAEPTSAGTYYLMGENCSGYGVVLEECLNGVFVGGTSEANDGGYSIGPNASYNTFIGIDLEINTTTDLVCNGSFNTFVNTVSTKSASFSGKCNSIIGGAFNAITNTGDTNDFINVRYGANGGAFTNSGVRSSKRNVYNLSTSLADPDTTNSQEAVRSGGGSVGTNTGTPEEIFTANRAGRCEVVAYLPSGDAANFTASATVLTEGTGVARIIANNGTALTITMSGLSVRVTQASGAPQTVQYRYLWVA